METNNLVVQEKRSKNNLSDQISQRLKSGIKTEIILRCSNKGEQRSITDSVSLCCLAPGSMLIKLAHGMCLFIRTPTYKQRSS